MTAKKVGFRTSIVETSCRMLNSRLRKSNSAFLIVVEFTTHTIGCAVFGAFIDNFRQIRPISVGTIRLRLRDWLDRRGDAGTGVCMPSHAPLTKDSSNNSFPDFGRHLVHGVPLSKISSVSRSKCRIWRLPIPIDFVVTRRTSKRPWVSADVMVTAEARCFAASYKLIVVVECALPLVHGLE